jgi:hypothetical protein
MTDMSTAAEHAEYAGQPIRVVRVVGGHPGVRVVSGP